MKVAALYLIALIFSFETLAAENATRSPMSYSGQIIEGNSTNPNLKNLQAVSWTQVSVAADIGDQVTSEKTDEFFSGLYIYTLIVLVYSLYWRKHNKPAD